MYYQLSGYFWLYSRLYFDLLFGIWTQIIIKVCAQKVYLFLFNYLVNFTEILIYNPIKKHNINALYHIIILNSDIYIYYNYIYYVNVYLENLKGNIACKWYFPKMYI